MSEDNVTRQLILETLEYDPKKRPKASELSARLNSLRLRGDKTPSKAIGPASRWYYLLNHEPRNPWHFAQIWQIDLSSASSSFSRGVNKKYSLESKVNCVRVSEFKNETNVNKKRKLINAGIVRADDHIT